MRRLSLLLTLTLLSACTDDATEPAHDLTGPQAAVVEAEPTIVDIANDLLAAEGSEFRIAYAEYLTASPDGQGASPNIIIARDLGNKRLALEFIPDDPRRGGLDGDPNTIDTWIDFTQGATSSGLSASTTANAVARAMETWNGETCSNPGIQLAGVAVDLGLVQRILGFGGGIAVSDVMHAGWLPGAFFDLLRPNGSQSILGVTFTLTFTSGDLDGNGLPDLGAREIYYNDAFSWADDGASSIDVQTVALHEAGHAMSQAHFGTVLFNPNSGSVVFSPRAVMNAVYSGVNRALDGTDRAGHCGLWGSWPQSPLKF